MWNLHYCLLLCHKEGFFVCSIYMYVLSLSEHKFYIHTHSCLYTKLIRNFVFYGLHFLSNIRRKKEAVICGKFLSRFVDNKKVNVSSFFHTHRCIIPQKFVLCTYKWWIVAEKFLLLLVHVYYTVIINVIIILINITTTIISFNDKRIFCTNDE